jgi:hypothetical protein
MYLFSYYFVFFEQLGRLYHRRRALGKVEDCPVDLVLTGTDTAPAIGHAARIHFAFRCISLRTILYFWTHSVGFIIDDVRREK